MTANSLLKNLLHIKGKTADTFGKIFNFGLTVMGVKDSISLLCVMSNCHGTVPVSWRM